MTCLGSNYTPHLPWVPVTHVNSSCISYRRRYSTRTRIILEMSTSLPGSQVKLRPLFSGCRLTVQEYDEPSRTILQRLF